MGKVLSYVEMIQNHNYMFIKKLFTLIGEERNIVRKKKLWNTVVLSQMQKEEIDTFFMKNYGKRISTKWHRLYQYYTGEFNYDYFPEVLLSTRLEPKLNPFKEANVFGNKNLLTQLFGDVEGLRIPVTYASRVHGVYRDGNNNLVDIDTFISIIQDKKEFVIKKTTNTNSGKDVEIVSQEEERDIKALLKMFGNDFVVQEKINQSKDLERLNSSSLNTFRLMTYICDNKVCLCPCALRIGRNGADKDNIHFGGIGVGVNEDGTLRKYAFTEYGDRMLKHPDSGVIFEGYNIEGAGEKIRSVACKCHEMIPFLGLLSWDMTIDSVGNITLIEVNTTGQAAWFSQMVNGESLFGDNTGKMLRMIGKCRS